MSKEPPFISFAEPRSGPSPLTELANRIAIQIAAGQIRQVEARLQAAIDRGQCSHSEPREDGGTTVYHLHGPTSRWFGRELAVLEQPLRVRGDAAACPHRDDCTECDFSCEPNAPQPLLEIRTASDDGSQYDGSQSDYAHQLEARRHSVRAPFPLDAAALDAARFGRSPLERLLPIARRYGPASDSFRDALGYAFDWSRARLFARDPLGEPVPLARSLTPREAPLAGVVVEVAPRSVIVTGTGVVTLLVSRLSADELEALETALRWEVRRRTGGARDAMGSEG